MGYSQSTPTVGGAPSPAGRQLLRLDMPLDPLEPGALKGAHRVLRGPRRSNAPGLPDRSLRMAKLQRKISGCFRTFSGAKAFCAVRSYPQTARKHGLKGLDVLVQLFRGHTVGAAPGRFSAITSAGGLNRYTPAHSLRCSAQHRFSSPLMC
jgi:hypothetical protein